MGNMIMNKRLEDGLNVNEEHRKEPERRIFPDHMYKGPLKLGDPNFRGLSKMESDPLIPQRMRDIARTALCKETVKQFEECSKKEGLSMVLSCQEAKNGMVKCIEKWFYDEDFKEKVIEEYLNERSHYRQTGIKTQRYKRGKFLDRPENDPPLDENGQYRPQKPRGWNDSYKDSGAPKWAEFKYD